MKQVLSVQDLSCLGKCSLTVALPVLSAMGCSCAVLPTAVLSTHTAFPAPHVHSLTQEIAPICAHWQKIGARFDGVSVGYLSDPAQAAAVEQLLQHFPAFTVVDPAMGDHGRLYSGLTEAHVAAMKRLCNRANVLLPNVTEACLLSGIPYRETGDPAYFRSLLEALGNLGAQTVILTGVSPEPGMIGYIGADASLGVFQRFVPRIDKQCHGTGDLFSAVFTGSCVLGCPADAAAEKAAGFVEQALRATEAASPFGVAFEQCLPLLTATPQL